MTSDLRNSCLTLPVRSGSMMPYLRPGGHVRIACDGADRARPGDIIVFREADTLVAHRLLLRLGRGRRRCLYQRGDAAGIGGWVRARQVLGVVTVSTAADGTVLYVRNRSAPVSRRHIAMLVARAVQARARSTLETLVSRGSSRRKHLASRAREDRDEYRIGIGATVLGLRLVPRRLAVLLPEYFGRPSVQGAPDLRLTIRVVRHRATSPLPNSLYYGKEGAAAGFALADGLVRGRYLPGTAGIELRVPLQLLDGNAIRIFEHLLHQAFSAAARARGEDCCLIHSSGVVRNGAGYLFVGPSGAGKSTIARLSRGEQVLNDEICMVSFAYRPPRLHGTPFNGFFKDKVEGQAPLEAVFLLEQAEAHRLRPVTMSEAVSAVFQQIVPPVTLDEPVGKAAYERMLDAAGRLLAHVPAYRLEFRQDAGFWRLIDGIKQKGDLP